MISEIHNYFDNYKNCINGIHVYCTYDKISISFSPRSFAEKSYIQHILQNFIKVIQPKLSKSMTLEVNVNHTHNIQNIKVTHQTKQLPHYKEPDFDYMPEIMD